MKLKSLLFLSIIVLGSSLFAQENEVDIQNLTTLELSLPEMSTDRPDQTEGATVMPFKAFQLETGFATNFVDENNRNIDIASTLLRFGVFKNAEIRFIYNMNKSLTDVARDKKLQVDPFQIGTKIKIYDGNKHQVGFLGHVAIPYLASKGNRPDYFATNFRFSINHDISDFYSIGYNVGIEYDGFSPSPVFIYTVVNGFSLTEKFGAFIELYGFVDKDNFPDHRFDAGLTYSVNSNFQIDVLGGVGLTEVSDNGFIGAGIVWRKFYK